MPSLTRPGGPSSKLLLGVTASSLILLYSQSSLFSFLSPRSRSLSSSRFDSSNPSIWEVMDGAPALANEEGVVPFPKRPDPELDSGSSKGKVKGAGKGKGKGTKGGGKKGSGDGPSFARPAANGEAAEGSDDDVKKPTDDDSTSHLTRQQLVERIEPYLLSWLSTPVPPYKAALERNVAQCPLWMEQQSNPDQLSDHIHEWENLSNEQLEDERRKVVDNVRKRLVEGYDYDHPTEDGGRREVPGPEEIVGDGTRGIVITGGNADTMRRLLVALRILRKRHKSKLPVEVWAFEEELRGSRLFTEAEDKDGKRKEELVDVEFKQLPSSKIQGIWKNFQIKAEAINRSRFSQILYLDSDNVPLIDPAFLFDAPSYQQYGAVFWPDITKDGPRNPIWRLTPQTCIPQDWQIDSGQILVDRQAQRGLVAAALLVAEEMQRNHDFWFRISGGDKDTFRYAFYALQLPWTRAPHWLSSGGGMLGNRFCGHTMFQYGLSPEEWSHFNSPQPLPHEARFHAPPLFMHSNLLKHSGMAFAPGKTFTHLQRVIGGTSKIPDSVARGNLDTLDQVRGTVDKGSIMCVILSTVDQKGTDAAGEDAGSRLHVAEEPWGEAWGGVLHDFASMFWEEGGLAGGF